ncbi:MAG TPA: ribosome silencing factor [Armatimonadota bacterium]|nr:ribosome silencing factor [Armatimonadota bacterium]
MNSLEIVNMVLEALASKKAQDIRVLDLQGLTVITDYFVIATASSPANSRAIVDAIDEAARDHGIKGLRPEGVGDATWVLIDLGGVVVHIFDAEHRDFYQLERLWADAPSVPVPAEYQS